MVTKALYYLSLSDGLGGGGNGQMAAYEFLASTLLFVAAVLITANAMDNVKVIAMIRVAIFFMVVLQILKFIMFTKFTIYPFQTVLGAGAMGKWPRTNFWHRRCCLLRRY